MRTVGNRQPAPITANASAAQLAEGARFNDQIHQVASGNNSFIAKGVYLFKTHTDANRHQQDCLADKAAREMDPAWFDASENIRVADALVVDIMLNTCSETYESLQRYAETSNLDGVPVRTVNLQGLLPTKQLDKNTADRVVLERALVALNVHPETPGHHTP